MLHQKLLRNDVIKRISARAESAVGTDRETGRRTVDVEARYTAPNWGNDDMWRAIVFRPERNRREQPIATTDTDIDRDRAGGIITADRYRAVRADTAARIDRWRRARADQMPRHRQIRNLKIPHTQIAANRQIACDIHIVIDCREVIDRELAL